MKNYILGFLVLSAFAVACENKDDKGAKTATGSTATVALPYAADYTTDFTNDVSDSDLLVTLNSYKYWETGDMKALRSTMGDSVTFLLPDGWKFNGPTDSLIKSISPFRDSLSTVSIKMITWTKNHSAKDSANWVNVWYKEIDTYKSGKTDSAEYEDDNLVRYNKLAYTSSHRQVLK